VAAGIARRRLAAEPKLVWDEPPQDAVYVHNELCVRGWTLGAERVTVTRKCFTLEQELAAVQRARDEAQARLEARRNLLRRPRRAVGRLVNGRS